MARNIRDAMDSVDSSLSIAINALADAASSDRAATRAEVVLARDSARDALRIVRDIKRSFVSLPPNAIVGSRSRALRLVGGDQ